MSFFVVFFIHLIPYFFASYINFGRSLLFFYIHLKFTKDFALSLRNFSFPKDKPERTMTFLRFFVVTLVLHAVSARSPSLKQGGAACNPYTNYCMNGGTCYTQYTAQPASTASPATTTTTHQPTTTQYIIVTQPVCDCQPQYAGDRCEISTQITTDKPLSQCAAVQCLNGGECRETGIAPYVVCLWAFSTWYFNF